MLNAVVTQRKPDQNALVTGTGGQTVEAVVTDAGRTVWAAAKRTWNLTKVPWTSHATLASGVTVRAAVRLRVNEMPRNLAVG